MKKTEIKTELTEERRKNLKLLQEYAQIKYEKEILIKALKIIIDHQE